MTFSILHLPCLILAQTDGEIFSTLKEEGFSKWLVYALVAVLVWERLEKFINRNKPGRMEMTGSFETSDKQAFADAKDVEELSAEVKSLREESVAQYNQAGVAGNNRVVALSKVLDDETAEIKARIDKIQEKLTEKLEEGFASLNTKLDNAALKVAFHDAEIPNLKERIGSLEGRYNTAIPKIHERIDDAMKHRGSKA